MCSAQLNDGAGNGGKPRTPLTLAGFGQFGRWVWLLAGPGLGFKQMPYALYI
jgi:hypothetical protein